MPLRDPFELYDEACADFYGETSSDPRGKAKQAAMEDTPEDKDYVEEGDDDDDDNANDDDDDYEEYLFLSHGLPILAFDAKGGVLGFETSL